MSHESSTRVNRSDRRELADRKAPDKAFRKVLKELRPSTPPPHPKPSPGPVRPPPQSSVVGTGPLKGIALAARALPSIRPEGLLQARVEMNIEVSRLSQSRVEGLNTQEEKLTGRVLDLIVKELDGPTRPGTAAGGDAEGLRGATKLDLIGSQAQGQAPGQGQGQPQQQQPQLPMQPQVTPSQHASPALKAHAAVELVRRIEVMLKSERPSLALTLSGAMSGKVEVERTGKGEVALRIQGSRGPPPAEDIARVRDELQSRGLKISSLSVS